MSIWNVNEVPGLTDGKGNETDDEGCQNDARRQDSQMWCSGLPEESTK